MTSPLCIEREDPGVHLIGPMFKLEPLSFCQKQPAMFCMSEQSYCYRVVPNLECKRDGWRYRVVRHISTRFRG